MVDKLIVVRGNDLLAVKQQTMLHAANLKDSSTSCCVEYVVIINYVTYCNPATGDAVVSANLP